MNKLKVYQKIDYTTKSDKDTLFIYRNDVFISAIENCTASCDVFYKMNWDINRLQDTISDLKKQLQNATGCLALYLEAADMISVQSCNKGTVKFLNSLENK
jgi:hypothetical protein